MGTSAEVAHIKLAFLEARPGYLNGNWCANSECLHIGGEGAGMRRGELYDSDGFLSYASRQVFS
jgi:hypothetical protein